MKFSKFIPAILSAAVIFSAAPPVSAGITYDQDSRTADIYLISGEIKPGDGEKFRRLVQKTRHKKYPAMLLLDSVGGNLGAAYAAMKVIIRENMSTVVLPGSRCYSACFILFIAGNPRVASKDASLGVHRASRIDGEDQSSKGTSVDMNEIYKLFKVPANIRLAMLETPPSEMYLLTQEDKKNISTGDQSPLDDIRPPEPEEEEPRRQTFASLSQLVQSLGRLNRSSDDALVSRALADVYLPEAARLIAPTLDARQRHLAGEAYQELIRQLDLAKKLLASAGVTDEYSLSGIRRDLLDAYAFQILLLAPQVAKMAEELNRKTPAYASSSAMADLAFADRYNELAELCQAGFCSADLIRRQEEAWLARSKALDGIMSGGRYASLMHESHRKLQLRFISKLMYAISSRVKDRTYIRRLDLSSLDSLMNSIVDLTGRMYQNRLTAADIAQYNAAMGAYVIPYLQHQLAEYGLSKEETDDLALTAGAYDLAYRDFFASSGRMTPGGLRHGAAGGSVKLEGKILRAGNMLMLLLAKNRRHLRYGPLYLKCSRLPCAASDMKAASQAMKNDYGAVSSGCAKGKCDGARLETQQMAYQRYRELYGRLAGRMSADQAHLMTCFESWHYGRMKRARSDYVK